MKSHYYSTATGAPEGGESQAGHWPREGPQEEGLAPAQGGPPAAAQGARVRPLHVHRPARTRLQERCVNVIIINSLSYPFVNELTQAFVFFLLATTVPYIFLNLAFFHFLIDFQWTPQ